MKRQMQKGFTLIELMIVVAIIAILAAIALPAYQSYVTESNEKACLAEAKGLANKRVTEVALGRSAPAGTSTEGCATATAVAAGDTADFEVDIIGGTVDATVSCDTSGNCKIVGGVN